MGAATGERPRVMPVRPPGAAAAAAAVARLGSHQQRAPAQILELQRPFAEVALALSSCGNPQVSSPFHRRVVGAFLEFFPRRPREAGVEQALALPGGGCLNVGPGQFTDDTELALCLARGLAGQAPSQGFPASAVARQYAWWCKPASHLTWATLRTTRLGCEAGRASPTVRPRPCRMCITSTARPAKQTGPSCGPRRWPCGPTASAPMPLRPAPRPTPSSATLTRHARMPMPRM